MSRIFNLTQLIIDPTRITNKSETLIDLCFTNIRHIADSGTIMWNASDHLPILWIKKKINPEVEKITFLGRSYVNLTSDEFKESIENFPVNSVLKEHDPSKAWDIYYDLIIKLLNRFWDTMKK